MRRRPNRLRRPLIVFVYLAVTLLTPRVAIGQDVTAPALKAAFIYNFVKFTEWPAPLPVSEPFVICVIGDPAVSDALGRVVEGRELAGHKMAVETGTSRPIHTCQVLYLAAGTAGETVRLVAGLKDSPVLTISDIAGFTDTGGIAQFFFDRGRLRFVIKFEAVRRSGLKMSSRLLSLGQQ